jgi:hypothetical protein
MTSILSREHYSDLIEIDSLHNLNFKIEQEPLAVVLEMALGIKEKPYWNRDYEASWKIENSKLYLMSIISYYNEDISMSRLFSKHINKYGKQKLVFADWYSGYIIVEINFLRHKYQNDEYYCTIYREITILKGKVISQNEFYAGERALPF